MTYDDGTEEWYKFDTNGVGTIIHSKDHDRIETWFDERGNMIHSKNLGFESWYDYNEKGNLIHRIDSTGTESWFDYDEKNNLIHTKDSVGYERWFNDKGEEIRFKNPSGYDSMKGL